MGKRRFSICLLAVSGVLSTSLLPSAVALAADKTIRLECVWDLSQDLKSGLVQRVSGVQMLMFKPTGKNYGQLEVDGTVNTLLATVHDPYITAETRYMSGATAITEKFEVNRFTGGIRKWLRWGEHGSLYQGKCTVMNKPLF